MTKRIGTPLAWRIALSAAAVAMIAASAATAQDKGTLNPKPLPPLANPDDPKTPAKELFGRRATAAPLQARSIGFYSRGCLAGAVAMPINGETWQVMRLSRNRMWGHPDLIKFLEELSVKGTKLGWTGLLVGDI
jgi:penicillin-insensitive murein endopeptidase